MSAPAFEKKPGGESLVQTQADAQAIGVGKRTLTEQLPAAATYTVKPGESLTAIAAKLKTTVEALKAANAAKLKAFPSKHGTVQCFNAGEVITVPRAAPEAAEPKAAPEATPDAPAPAQPGMFDNLLDRVTGAAHGLWDRLTGGGAASEGHAGDKAGKPGAGDASAGDAAGAKAVADQRDADAGDAAPFAELTDAQRGAKLSTMQPDELGTVDDLGMSATGKAAAKKRGQWLTAAQVHAAGKNKSGDAYRASVDALLDQTELTEDQGKIVAAARAFATAPRPLTPEQEHHAAIDWSKAQITLDGVTLNADLQARIERYVRFLAWANLVTGPTPIGSVMRSPATAHRLSVAWMFNLVKNNSASTSLHHAANRQKLVANVTANGGTDKDGTTWLSETTVEGLKAKKDDDAALYEYIKTTAAPEADKVQHQPAVAAEGYKTADKRHPNIAPGTFVSNHLLGEAVDMKPPFVFSNKFDPIIDAIALHFGLWRAVKDDSSSPEHWHYERVGSPPGAEHADE
jgi:hypothetical protein